MHWQFKKNKRYNKDMIWTEKRPKINRNLVGYIWKNGKMKKKKK